MTSELPDGLARVASSADPYTRPEDDPISLDATPCALLELGKGLPDSRRTFGRRNDVDPVRHLIGTTRWGGLPEHEAYYMIDTES